MLFYEQDETINITKLLTNICLSKPRRGDMLVIVETNLIYYSNPSGVIR